MVAWPERDPSHLSARIRRNNRKLSVQKLWLYKGMTSTYSTFDAKAKLSEILDKVKNGEEVVITRHGKAVAKILPIVQTGRRQLGFGVSEVGFLRGWDEPLSAGDLIGE